MYLKEVFNELGRWLVLGIVAVGMFVGGYAAGHYEGWWEGYEEQSVYSQRFMKWYEECGKDRAELIYELHPHWRDTVVIVRTEAR